ncbi:MAG: thiamine-phosphate kinase [archaeon]
MKVMELGEFGLIRRIAQDIDDARVIKGIGDDAAVIDAGDKYLLVTTDMLVQNDHFSLDWSTPKQIGIKAMESNVSDIAAMGGTADYAFVSICLTRDTTVKFVDGLYEGLRFSANNHNVKIIGGDTTHGGLVVINIAILGTVAKDMLRLRSHAKPGDLIAVTGTLGGSAAGLQLLTDKVHCDKRLLQKHLEPGCRAKAALAIAKHANAMIDVSDGLASEVRHICEESRVGAEIIREKIPLSKETKEAANLTNKDPYYFALNGGEDYELVFTIPENRAESLRNEFSDFTVVGKIKEEGISLLHNGKPVDLGSGYDHFR